MKLYEIRPVEALCEVEVGEVFLYAPDGLLYQLVHRDIVKAVVRRWTWWDEVKLFFKLWRSGKLDGTTK